MSSLNGRVLRPDSVALLRATVGVLMAVSVFSFVISFSSQRELAMQARVPEWAAMFYPLIIDGSILIAEVATLILSTRRHAITRGYPWAVLAIFGGLSWWANGTHAVGRPLTEIEIYILGGVPTVALLLTAHMVIVMLRTPQATASDAAVMEKAAKEEGRKIARERAAAAPVLTPAAPVVPLPVRTAASASKPTTVAPSGVDRDAVVAQIREHFETTGEWMSGQSVGDLLGQSKKTGVRLVNQVKAEHGDAAEVAVDRFEPAPI